MSHHCKANPCCGDGWNCKIPIPQYASGLTSHNPPEKTFDSVMKDHMDREKIASMHVDLGPSATPEKLEETFSSLSSLFKEYNELSNLEKLEARFHFLEKLVKEISKFGSASFDAWNSMSEGESKLRQEIFRLCELRSAIDMREHIDFIKSKRG